jgi:hypothetical protein
MAGLFLTCPLCGFAFERTDALCQHGYPLGSACHLARCPVCEYEFPENLPTGSWFRKLFPEKEEPEVPVRGDSLLTVRDLGVGETVLALELDVAADIVVRRA